MTLLAGTDHIETERLLLRRMNEGDLHFLIAIHADPEVARSSCRTATAARC